MAVGAFKNAKVSGASTTAPGTSLYTVPAGKYTSIHAIYVTNRYNLEDLYVNIAIDDGAGNLFYIAYLYPVAANLGAVWERPINLEDGEILKVTASRANSIDVVASVLEFTP
jgi:hypothetical protein